MLHYHGNVVVGKSPSRFVRWVRQFLSRQASAILHRPRVLILDEPASGLDPHASRNACPMFAPVALLVWIRSFAKIETFTSSSSPWNW